MNYGLVGYFKKPFKPLIVLLAVIAILLLFVYVQASGQTIQGKVMQVKDGDTVVISPAEGGQFFVCRLYGIDAPETSQPYGDEATRELKRFVLGQVVVVQTTGDKTYGREVCIIKKDGRDINLEMVRSGYAWAYRQYLKRPHASEYIEAEAEARRQKLGLWQQSNPQPPWEWRRR